MRVLLIDDHLLLRTGLASLLEHCREGCEVATADDADTALLVVATDPVDLTIVNLDMSESNALHALSRLHAEAPRVPIIAMTSSREPARWRRALEAGASGLVTRSTTPAELCTCMTRVLTGAAYVPATLWHESGGVAPLRRGMAERPMLDLSCRQHEVLMHLLRGESNKTISRSLDISPNTVKTHVAAIFRALGASNRTEAVYYAARVGISPN